MKSKWIARKLTDRGYRLTPQRLMVVAAIEDAEDHISAEEIFEQVIKRYPHMNISTVYRTLELMKEQGLVTETDMGDGRVRYHCMGKGHHHHLICQNCGRIIDVDEAVLDPLWADLKRRFGFQAAMTHMAIFGRCENCQD